MNLEEHIDILKEYPFKVSYPRGGTLQLLVWHTPWEQHRVLAASRKDHIEAMLRSVLVKEGPEARPVAYWHAEICAPPAELVLTYARGRMLEDVDHFRWYVAGLFQQAVRNKARPEKHPYRQGALRCLSYRERWGGSGQGDKGHMQCLNCFGGWLPPGQTVESLYLLRRNDPRGQMVRPIARRVRMKGEVEYFPSQAPEADPIRSLYALEQNFGHHSHGLEIKEVKKQEETGEYWYGPNHSITPTTFFFHGKELELPPEFVQMHETLKAEHAREEEAKKIAFVAKRQREAEEATDELAKYLVRP